MKKVYEIALCYDEKYENVKTYEYDTLRDMINDLDFYLYDDEIEELNRIELSILIQDEDGENEEIYTFGTIDAKEFNAGFDRKVLRSEL